MAKVNVCDICLKEGKLTKTSTYMKVARRPDLRLDYCKGCKSKIPSGLIDYTQFVYRLSGVELSHEEATKMARR